jgi:hypothetical protein
VRSTFSSPLSAAGSIGSKLAAAGFSQTEFDLGLIHPPETPPPLEPDDDTNRPIDGPALLAALAADGVVGQTFPAYEFRPQQLDMLRSVAEAFNNGDHLLVEAGTGTG